MIGWNEGSRIVTEDGKIQAKGFGCLWKAPAMPTNTDAGAIITFNEDGSINVHCGVVEIGRGIKTALATDSTQKNGRGCRSGTCNNGCQYFHITPSIGLLQPAEA